MKKKILLVLKILGVLILLLAVAAFFTARHFGKTFLSFEDDYVEQLEFKEVTVDGYTFLDRNDNII